MWCQHWPVAFPNLNITPKGHDFIFVLLKIVKEHNIFYMFYKVEEKGKKMHAVLNDIQRKIWCIRNPFDACGNILNDMNSGMSWILLLWFL